jgi:hypothetical protein
MENWQQSIFTNFIQKRTEKKTIVFIRLEHAGTTGLDKWIAAPTALWIGMHWPVIVALGDRPDMHFNHVLNYQIQLLASKSKSEKTNQFYELLQIL